jgi:2-polyprenyl-3-methyl-5-hydroxy-6-metoxy-1,4-benzoquinol methylase
LQGINHQKFIRTFIPVDSLKVKCWCGNDELEPFGEGYRLCQRCQTLVADSSAQMQNPRVTDDAADYYGRDYWFDHQTGDLSCPDIVARSRSDLAERCVHWLRSLLEFKLPPCKVLEIGAAHGGFVAMMRQAGFDAHGLELSPSIVEFAANTFSVPMLTGPIEDQTSIAPGSLDAIVLMDVIEHLPDPLGTLARCFDLLKPNGILLAQTPAYPAGKSLPQLREEASKFPMMLDRNEHLFLFSKSAVRELCRRLDVPNLEFIPAMFGFYDMSFVASRSVLLRTDAEQQSAALCQSVPGRFIQALLDLDQRRLSLLSKYRTLASTQTPAHAR